jgi:hypothetical protein
MDRRLRWMPFLGPSTLPLQQTLFPVPPNLRDAATHGYYYDPEPVLWDASRYGPVEFHPTNLLEQHQPPIYVHTGGSQHPPPMAIHNPSDDLGESAPFPNLCERDKKVFSMLRITAERPIRRIVPPNTGGLCRMWKNDPTGPANEGSLLSLLLEEAQIPLQWYRGTSGS